MGTGTLIIGKIVAGILFSLPVIWPALLIIGIFVAIGYAKSPRSQLRSELMSGCFQICLLIIAVWGGGIWMVYCAYKWLMSQH